MWWCLQSLPQTNLLRTEPVLCQVGDMAIFFDSFYVPLAYFCTEIKEVAKMYKSPFERLDTYNTFYIQWLLRRRWDCINIMKKQELYIYRYLCIFFQTHVFDNQIIAKRKTFIRNIHDPISKMILNRLTVLRKRNLFTKYEHAVHKSCWRNKVYFSAVSCLILPQ